jgi:hypothetical protein
MKLLTKELEQKLIKNFEANNDKENTTDFKPVVKFFGGGACTWLISEYNPEDKIFFGLCDLGMGEPELGYVSREELESIRFLPFRLPVERDMHWTATKTLAEYAKEANEHRRIKS